jgi:hypothetical protein
MAHIDPRLQRIKRFGTTDDRQSIVIVSGPAPRDR